MDQTRLLYREDMDEVRGRLTTWWNGGDIGRPPLALSFPRETPLEEIPPMPQPTGWQTGYSTSNYAFRVYLARRAPGRFEYAGEAVPAVSPDLAPNCLALFLGCRGVEMPGTVWCEPFLEDPEQARFAFDPDNFYWTFCTRLARELAALGRGKFLLAFPDLIEGLDTLEAMRGGQRLLMDLFDRPEWVRTSLRRITDLYFHYYDILYDILRDEVGGSHFWAWAPGRMAKFQCDFSAMIGPDMFGEFMAPVLAEMCQRVSYCMYHWDGPGAIVHHDHLLAIPDLDMLQWTPGAGQPSTEDPCWWPLYHKTIDAGKKVYASPGSLSGLRAMKKEFGVKLKSFYMSLRVADRKEAAEALAIAEV